MDSLKEGFKKTNFRVAQDSFSFYILKSNTNYVLLLSKIIIKIYEIIFFALKF